MIYPAPVFAKIRLHSQAIQSAAQILGLPPAMLAAAIAEEIDDHEQRFKPLALLRNNLFDAYTARFASHAAISADIAFLSALPENDQRLTKPGLRQKLRHVALRDVGLGNIRILTANQLLTDYERLNPQSDPLGIMHYRQDMAALVVDLVYFRNGVQAKFAGLMVREACNWFSRKIPDQWGQMSDHDRTGLTTTYYNLGRERIQDRWQKSTHNGKAPYQPHPSDDGLGSIANFGKISEALGLVV